MPQPSRATILIERSPFFVTAGEEATAALLRASFTQLLPRGAVLFEQGDQADFLHVTLEGSVGLQARVDGDRATTVEILGAGELYLAPAALLGLPYLASAVALTEVRVLMIPSDTFREVMTWSFPLNRATSELLARHWRLMVDQVVDLKLRSAEDRLARFLARRVPESAGAACASLPEPRTAIAGRLGMTSETLSRAMASLEKRGKLHRDADGAVVSDRASLS